MKTYRITYHSYVPAGYEDSGWGTNSFIFRSPNVGGPSKEAVKTAVLQNSLECTDEQPDLQTIKVEEI